MDYTNVITPVEIILGIAISSVIGWAVWVTRRIFGIPNVDKECLVRIEDKLDNIDDKLELFKEEVKTYYKTK